MQKKLLTINELRVWAAMEIIDHSTDLHRRFFAPLCPCLEASQSQRHCQEYSDNDADQRHPLFAVLITDTHSLRQLGRRGKSMGVCHGDDLLSSIAAEQLRWHTTRLVEPQAGSGNPSANETVAFTITRFTILTMSSLFLAVSPSADTASQLVATIGVWAAIAACFAKVFHMVFFKKKGR